MREERTGRAEGEKRRQKETVTRWYGRHTPSKWNETKKNNAKSRQPISNELREEETTSWNCLGDNLMELSVVKRRQPNVITLTVKRRQPNRGVVRQNGYKEGSQSFLWLVGSRVEQSHQTADGVSSVKAEWSLLTWWSAFFSTFRYTRAWVGSLLRCLHLVD